MLLHLWLDIAGRAHLFSPFLHLFVCLFVLFFQHNSDQAAGDRGRDCESGHLTYRSGDVLEERCRFSSVAVD